jgi:5-methylcytosine-specific restriction enzyme A
MVEMQRLADLKPTKREKVFDLAQKAGLNVSDWKNSSSNPSRYKANPKYCYEWCYVEPGKVVILNLWHDALEVRNGEIVEVGNFKADVQQNSGPEGRPEWVRRGTKLYKALMTAVSENLAVRVIINDGVRRRSGDPKSVNSNVMFRRLDPEPWTITHYDWSSGAHVITRGLLTRKFVDQFDLDQAEKLEAERVERTGFVYRRDPKVRDTVRLRANGHCEFCGDTGFRTIGGSIYVETHHVVPLSEEGADHPSNVMALCPNDHRDAHHGENRIELRERMLEKLKAMLGH